MDPDVNRARVGAPEPSQHILVRARADYNVLRQAIDECEAKYQDLMRIMYRFGVRVAEILPEKKEETQLREKNFNCKH